MLAVNLLLRDRLVEVDASIADLKSHLQLLEETRRLLQEQLDCIVYPILSLPPEITSEIFLECLPPPPSPSMGSRQQSSHRNNVAPLLLFYVCRAWRKIALSTPRLWDSLHLFHSTIRRFPRTSTMAKVITDWFSRAGSSPLTLSLRLYVAQTAVGASATVLSTILRPIAPRLKKLYLEVARADELADIGPFPILETFTISYHPTEYPDSPLKLFSAAPRLRRLIFTRRTRPSMFILPQAISEVTCHGFLIADDLLQLLRDAPFLKKLACSLCEFPPRTKPFIHSHLETLHCNSQPFLALLRLPALQTLHLFDGHESTADDFPSFLSSCPRLRRLFAHSIRSLSVDWFAAIPGLVDIDVTDPKQPFLSDFFARLDRTTDSGFLPYLRTLAFRDAAFELDGSVLQALSSRSTAGEFTAVLASFQQFWPRSDSGPSEGYMEESTVAACRELVGRGMSVHVGPEGNNLVQ
ncbi:hypothetical protein C8R46DRAFT_959114 [Mycena filopes]|nr:hypothetical protein C8R46DRAFT_959114 [Mycena filopes]